jgi:hypothetical protein
MLAKKLALIDEQTSPLFRIMFIYDSANPARRRFRNNICAFHIGNGLILTVAHNIRIEAKKLDSIDEAYFSAKILPHLDENQTALFNQCYPFDPATNKRYANFPNPSDAQSVIYALKQLKFDTRWLNLINNNICNPFLIVQFANNQYYNDAGLTSHFDGTNSFYEPQINRYTFLLPLKLVQAFYGQDIAVYRIINTHTDIINRLPKIEADTSVLDDDARNFYCIQSSPNIEAGRLLNKAQVDGFAQHFTIFQDPIGGNYTSEGLRYLIKGYFRFGSSGAPYVFYDEEAGSFKVNAIQSEACPIQLSINNNMGGNFQYVNALATPLHLIEKELNGKIV